MVLKSIDGEDPLTGTNWLSGKPSTILMRMVSAVIGFSVLVFLFRVGAGQGSTFLGDTVASLTGGRVQGGEGSGKVVV